MMKSPLNEMLIEEMKIKRCEIELIPPTGMTLEEAHDYIDCLKEVIKLQKELAAFKAINTELGLEVNKLSKLVAHLKL